MKKYYATLTEMLVIAFLLGFSISMSQSFGSRFGVLGYVLGFIGGGLAILLGLAFIALLLDLWTGGIPRLPLCENNKCKGPYNYTSSKLDDGTYTNQCKCGNRYKRDKRRFLKIDKDGKESKYLIWRPFRGWKIDK